MPIDDFTNGDRASATWFKIKQYLAVRLEKLRNEMEADLTLDDTNKLRGRIREIKSLMKLDEERPYVAKQPSPEL